MPAFTNHLANETSPYLLQHAHNPVDWYAWGEEALTRAKKEDKPMLVSIGYAACHWCHVMERESFENEKTAAIMNEHFINIKIDREERPDLDHIYMDAVQAMTGSGGWPLNVFLTPDGKPFYGGTYFPPKRAFNRPSWEEILLGVAGSFREKRDDIDKQADQMTKHLLQSNSFGVDSGPDPDELFTAENTALAFANLMKTADVEWGGFGKAPKFPQTFSIQFLLRRHFTLNPGGFLPDGDTTNEPGLKQALLSLDKMIEGGIYDQAGGGFARYSTDVEWLAPHFEKMLYDNALLLGVLSEAYQLTKVPRYRQVIIETIEFIKRELMLEDDAGLGFYSALDADSEGEEGKFYVWDRRVVDELLGNDAAIFSDYYDISSWGNWEGKNILRIKEPLEVFAAKKEVTPSQLASILENGKRKLLQARSLRIRPQLDDKIILSWNALMNTALSKAFAATGDGTYRDLAIRNMELLLDHFSVSGGDELYHTWKSQQGKYPAFLDDYAMLIQALIHLQEITMDRKWLIRAKALTVYVIGQFGEKETGFFFYTPEGQSDVIIRKKEVYDGAIPSGNSVMAHNLHQLGILFDEKGWSERSRLMALGIGKTVVRYPGSFGNWACLLQEIQAGTNELAVVGKQAEKLHGELLAEYIPHRVYMAALEPDNSYPLLNGKTAQDPPLVWLCRNFRCLSPVDSVKALMPLIDSVESIN